MDIEMRRANAADAALLALLGRITFAESFGYLFRDHPGDLTPYPNATFRVTKIERSLDKAQNAYWLAFHRRLPVGYAKLKHGSEIPGRSGQSTATQLQKIYVLREFIGQRLGAALLGRVLPEAAVRAPVLWLDVLRENTRALRFYETHGFCVLCEDTHTIGAQTFAFDLMARDLQ